MQHTLQSIAALINRHPPASAYVIGSRVMATVYLWDPETDQPVPEQHKIRTMDEALALLGY